MQLRRKSGEPQWKVKGAVPGLQKEIKPVSITSDTSGHIFICDEANKCVEVFLMDGRHLDCIMKSEEDGFGEPVLVRWCKKSSSLIVAHLKEKHNNYISVIKLNL